MTSDRPGGHIIISRLSCQFHIDAEKVYVSGQSMGGHKHTVNKKRTQPSYPCTTGCEKWTARISTSVSTCSSHRTPSMCR